MVVGRLFQPAVQLVLEYGGVEFDARLASLFLRLFRLSASRYNVANLLRFAFLVSYGGEAG